MVIRRRVFAVCLLILFSSLVFAQGRQGGRGRGPRGPVTVTLLKPARVFDGETMHEGWVVLVRGDRIDSAGPSVNSDGAKVIELPGATLMPGLVEGHSHMMLHAYNETSWNDQVAHEAPGCASRGPSIICARR